MIILVTIAADKSYKRYINVPKLRNLENHLREEPLENHPIVIGFFCSWCVMRVDVTSIEHHLISHLKADEK